MGGMLFYNVVRDGLSEEVTLDRTLNNGRDKAMQISDRGNGRYKGPEAGAKAWSKETRRFHLCSEGRVGRDEIREGRGRMGRWGQFIHCFMDQDKEPKFHSE